MKRLVIFASGSGSNAENIIHHFAPSKSATVTHVLSNNQHAKVFERCKRLKIPISLFDKEDFAQEDTVLQFLLQEADFIILAGFLWKIPSKIIAAFPNKIINIHPALLPKYGGKGMYGMHVHKAVKENKETETGISIHYVNENYDEGAIIFQTKTILSTEDTPETIAHKVHELEYEHFPKVIEQVINKYV
ncbi:phosphoribosylglycinamide formyltransferase [Tenacibaculum maritimum]|uniref:phosphoribosylglycinamide formyltransferase n=1 Tax=Tenacibaculum maritimum TaxID=107401 RepID=UPI001E408231|nr:phosphoribosylglycinamide formyltransferase [Tenacibaculum maritimum]MCD9584046.1 phosphoribosylglycinamide formyltransferase [Tenacibaculum maritimum]MCD9610378.1 phosphoribosylglycinamide formyltransferase [Tenacibaculum maritimum]MCD9620060.1 phosphoribosylglycinamide formyltransferase [Tenacibaculum maritimum]MCD9626414.1 phosphoribosylglycinamide formyltransferase [Tenacibaculum maritimum]MCD9628989.1 phosphoribosylglycinamide formyltransferase [Tenacibaculum maritimum]